VDAAVADLFARYDVVRMYADPPYWTSEVAQWQASHGEKVVSPWHTNRPVQMHAACEQLLTDVTKADSRFRHDGCETTSIHVRNARKAARPANRYVLRKATPQQKIDLAVCSVLAHEAANDAIKAGQAKPKKKSKMLILR
jgi:phage terminase large subunit-like protein